MNFFEVEIEPFVEWLNYARNSFVDMVQTLIDVAHVFELNTRPYVPFETGRLEHSFKFVVEEISSDFIEVGMQYSAVDPDSGFNYALYQHDEELRHTVKPWAGIRTEAEYMRWGIYHTKDEAYKMIETDYLSLFGRIKR